MFDPATQRCSVGGDRISLSTREHQLLHHLLRHKGQVISKADLLDSIWGPDTTDDPNVVEVYIGYLRRKIGAERINTVRGSGYRLVDPDVE